MMREVLMFVFAACLALFAISGATAQTLTTGSIEGTVVDPNGAAVPGITVTVTREGGTPISVATDDNGMFRISQIEPGKYTIVVEESKGFLTKASHDSPVCRIIASCYPDLIE